jgi:anti-sigma factor RsiW
VPSLPTANFPSAGASLWVMADFDRCSEWHALASCELDGELEEFDGVRLQHHLSECASCAAWCVDVRRLRELLGTAQPELLEQPVSMPSLRRLSRVSALAGASASVAAAAAAAALVVGLPTIGGSPASSGSIRDGNSPAPQSANSIDRALLLTTFKQTFVVTRPGVQNPAAELE